MKTEEIFIDRLNRYITFYVGQNQDENFDVIDKGSDEDLWFHAKNNSSCHVVAIVPNDINKKNVKYIVKMGALLCKKNTNKLKILKNVAFIYSYIKNVDKTDVLGSVIVKNEKNISI